ncbi:MAG: hypothetical protein V7746_02230 [Halioglobus sp.]
MVDKPQSNDKSLAIAAEALYLINLMLLPGVGFAILFALYLSTHSQANPLAKNHLSQTLGVSVIGGSVIIVVGALIAFFGGLDVAYTWVWIVFYFTIVHSSLIIMGVFGFINAFNDQHFNYPIVGRWFHQ